MVFAASCDASCRRPGLVRRDPRRGSAVITVLVLAAVTAVIASGFLFRSLQEAKLANRSFYQAVVLNLAEAGLEEGLYAANTGNVTTAAGWALASGSTTDYVKSITSGLTFEQATGAIHVRVDNATSTTPVITAAGVVTFPGQPKIVKQVRIGGQGSSRIWDNTIVTKGNLTFSGSTDIDSYDSSLGPYNAATNRSDKATVASTGTVQVSGSSNIYGYVATSGSTPSVGPGGRIYGATSPASPAVDPSRVRADFNTNLTDATAPTGAAISLGGINSSLLLPRVGDVPGPNGRYLYSTPSISLSGSSAVTINGPVDLISVGNVDLGGTSEIVIGAASNDSLNLYSSGNVTISGNGMVNNSGKPSKAAIWGTMASPGSQTVSLSGSSAFLGTVYAPNADISLSGSAGIFGAVIGKTTAISGGTLHYDVRLAEGMAVGGPTPGNGSTSWMVRVTSWVELKDAPGSGQAFARDARAPFDTLF